MYECFKSKDAWMSAKGEEGIVYAESFKTTGIPRPVDNLIDSCFEFEEYDSPEITTLVDMLRMAMKSIKKVT